MGGGLSSAAAAAAPRSSAVGDDSAAVPEVQVLSAAAAVPSETAAEAAAEAAAEVAAAADSAAEVAAAAQWLVEDGKLLWYHRELDADTLQARLRLLSRHLEAAATTAAAPSAAGSDGVSVVHKVSVSRIVLVGNPLVAVPVCALARVCRNVEGMAVSTCELERFDCACNCTVMAGSATATATATDSSTGSQQATSFAAHFPVLSELAADDNVNLCGGSGGTIPDCLWGLATLTSLSLANTGLARLDRGDRLCERFPSLKTLTLRDNRLTSVPDELFDLPNLETLYLGSNELVALPAAVGRAKRLATLGLRGNRLSALPAELGGVASLTNLVVSHNRLEALPASLARLRQLRCLIVEHNTLSAVPDGVCCIATLEQLVLNHNRLAAVPDDLVDAGDHLLWLTLSGNAPTLRVPSLESVETGNDDAAASTGEDGGATRRDLPLVLEGPGPISPVGERYRRGVCETQKVLACLRHACNKNDGPRL